MDRAATCVRCDRARDDHECRFCAVVENPDKPVEDGGMSAALVQHACADSKLDPVSRCAHCAAPLEVGVTLWTEDEQTLSFCNMVHMLQHARYAMTLLYDQLIRA